MILGRNGELVSDDFSVTDESGNLVSGLSSGVFTSDLFDPAGTEISSTVPVSISELGNGHYRATFTPNSIGLWMLVVYHSSYFPWGKTNNIQVFNNDFDTITELLIRTLGLGQENYYIDNTTYDSDGNLVTGRIRIYDEASNVGSGTGVNATYDISAVYTNKLLTSYSVKKV